MDEYHWCKERGQDLDTRLWGQELEQDTTSDQDTRSQKRRYSSKALDSTDPEERRYPLRKRQLSVKAAAFIIE